MRLFVFNKIRYLVILFIFNSGYYCIADDMTDKTTEALYYQVGLNGLVNNFNRNIRNELELRKLGGITKASLYLYSSYKSRCLKFPIDNNQVSIYTDKIEFRIPL